MDLNGSGFCNPRNQHFGHVSFSFWGPLLHASKQREVHLPRFSLFSRKRGECNFSSVKKISRAPQSAKNIGHVWLVVELEKMPLALLNLPGYILAPSLGRIQGGLLSLQMGFFLPL